MFKQLTAGFTFTSIYHGSYYPLLYFKKGSNIAGVGPKDYAIRYDGMKI
jgi:hypothetical protein